MKRSLLNLARGWVLTTVISISSTRALWGHTRCAMGARIPSNAVSSLRHSSALTSNHRRHSSALGPALSIATGYRPHSHGSLLFAASPQTGEQGQDRQSAPYSSSASAKEAKFGLDGLSVAELKRLLQERDVDFRDCIEKRELVARLEEAMKQGTAPKGGVENYAGLSSDENRMINLFKTTAPSVVFIQTTQLARESPFSLRALEVPQGTGSGFIWDSQGHIVTNFHVIQNAVRSRTGGIKVSLQDRMEDFDADIVGVEPDNDLAVLKLRIPAGKRVQLTPVSVGSSSELLVGQSVLAIGNPFGLDHTLTTGVVSALGREVRGATGNTLKGCVQTDAAINPGNSGGPLLDSQGRLIGVNTAIVSSSGSSAGIGFAIPVDTVRRVVTQLIRYGRVQRPMLGVQVADDQIMQGIARRMNVNLEGVMVVEVSPRSPAAAPVSGAALQGMQRHPDGSMSLGDVILTINDVPIRKVEDLLSVIEEKELGSVVTLRVKRRGTGLEEDVQIRLDQSRRTSF